MAKQSYTCELLTNSDNLVLSLPGEAIADEVMKCGEVSGRDVDKVEKYNIELTGDALKYRVHSRLAYVCTVAQRVIVGDCVFFVCNVDDIFVNENERHIYSWGKDQSLRPIE